MLSPLGRNFYLNITPNNLVHFYLHTDAVPEGSPTTVKIRELSSKDWEKSLTESTASLCSSRSVTDCRLPVTSCVNGHTSTDIPSLRIQSRNSFVNPTQKPSLSELVSSLRNCNSVRTPAPNRTGFSVSSAPDSASTGSTVANGSHGIVLSRDSLHHTQTCAVKRNDQSNISNCHAATRCEASYMPESQCLQTPSQTTGARFRFKRTPTTPVPSQGQSSDVHHTSSARLQCSAAASATTSQCQPLSLIPVSVGPSATAVSQTANTAVDDMWNAGKLDLLCAGE